MKKALVSIIIGDRYREFWRQHCERSWRTYADRFGYDIVIFDRVPGPVEAHKTIHWYKLLILGKEPLRRYDRVVWIDSDIVINNVRAPSILEGVPADKVGVTLYGDLQDELLRPIVWERWQQAFTQRGGPPDILQVFWQNYYRHAGLQTDANVRFNTGVLVLTPEMHRTFLEDVFKKYPKNAFDFEQTYLNFELVANGRYHVLDRRFNSQVGDELLKSYPFLFVLDDEAPALLKHKGFVELAKLCLLTLYDNSYFVHFCGARWQAPLLTEAITMLDGRNLRDLARRLFAPEAVPADGETSASNH